MTSQSSVLGEISGLQHNLIVWPCSGPGRALVLLHRYKICISFVVFQMSWLGNSVASFQYFQNTFFYQNLEPNKPCINAHLNYPFLDFLKNSSMFPQPDLSSNITCTLMLTSNLAATEWINIDCNKEVLTCSDICEEPHPMSQIDAKTSNKTCSRTSIVQGALCFEFLWFDGEYTVSFNLSTLFCRKKKKHFPQSGPNVSEIKGLGFLPSAVVSTFPPLLEQEDTKSKRIIHHTFEKVWNWFEKKQEVKPIEAAKGLVICWEVQQTFYLFGSVFACTNGGYISIVSVCDGKFDCLFW